jgi:hypothetical protein
MLNYPSRHLKRTATHFLCTLWSGMYIVVVGVVVLMLT